MGAHGNGRSDDGGETRSRGCTAPTFVHFATCRGDDSIGAIVIRTAGSGTAFGGRSSFYPVFAGVSRSLAHFQSVGNGTVTGRYLCRWRSSRTRGRWQRYGWSGGNRRGKDDHRSVQSGISGKGNRRNLYAGIGRVQRTSILQRGRSSAGRCRFQPQSGKSSGSMGGRFVQPASYLASDLEPAYLDSNESNVATVPRTLRPYRPRTYQRKSVAIDMRVERGEP